MEEKIKADNLIESTSFSSQMMMISEISSFSAAMPNSSLFDISCRELSEHDDNHKSKFGFLEMSSNIRDFDYLPSYSRTFDDFMIENINTDHLIPIESQSKPTLSHLLPSPVLEYSEVVNTPATPNSCSISSSSTDLAGNDDQKNTGNVQENDDDDDDVVEEENQEKTKKQLLMKPKKKKQKRERDPRFAFMTKSDVDHLDDGYRWRKYGQKAVKNSPFPRSYYRCTSTACGVKKRVERSSEDPSIVVTTYEGTHTHPCPIVPRGTFGIIPETTAFGGGRVGGLGGGGSSSHLVMPTQMLQYQQKTQPYFHNLTSQLRFITTTTSSTDHKSKSNPSPLIQERPFCPSTSSSGRDHGLLQDMLPSKMLKEPKEE
ncbi:hypothetical protein OROGR_014497 [Orobanche gracilis]